MRSYRPIALLMVLAAAVSLTGVAQAQARFARLRGKVLDADTRAPVQGARVIIAATGRYATTDSTGAFDVRDIPSGIIRFIFASEGYPRAQVVLAFAPGETMTQDFELDATPPAEDSLATRRVQELPTTEVTAAPSRGVRYMDFERRMKTGRGHYITREEIEARGYATLQESVRFMRGVTIECASTQTCSIRMVRAPVGCYPQYIVDGRQDNMFGPYVAIRDIEGMEVYTGASDVPGEFAGSDASCGTVVIWTRSGPGAKPDTARKPG